MDRFRVRKIDPDSLYEVEVWDSIGGTYGPGGVEIRYGSDGFYLSFTEAYAGTVIPAFGGYTRPEAAFEAFEMYVNEYAETGPEDEPNY